jgi:hypothetical protein
MPSAFDNNDFKHYPEIFLLLEASKLLVCEYVSTTLDNEAFLAHIKQAEAENRIAVFHHVDFEDISVSHRDFLTPVIFSKCRFKGLVKLTSNQFFYKLFFHSVVFDKAVKFRLSNFYNGVSILDSSFKHHVSFERSKFLASYIKYMARDHLQLTSDFTKAFNGNNTVDFLGVEFHKDCLFVNAYFGCSVLFSHYYGRNSKFHGECDFSCITEETEQFAIKTYAQAETEQPAKEIEIYLDKFHRISFVAVEFYGELTFENRIFQKKTLFKDSVFYRAPKFHNAELHQDTDFRGADFRDISSEGAERAYRTLKLIMDKKRARLEEGMFFALEQKTILGTPLLAYKFPIIDRMRFAVDKFIRLVVFGKENIASKSTTPLFDPDTIHYSGFYVSLTEKLVSFMYFLMSNYGQSFKRPVVIIAISLVTIFPFLYMVGFSDTMLIDGRWDIAYQVSFQQLFRPFEIYAVRFREHYTDVPIGFYILATVQALMNMGLLMLFALAVRGRFRMY